MNVDQGFVPPPPLPPAPEPAFPDPTAPVARPGRARRRARTTVALMTAAGLVGAGYIGYAVGHRGGALFPSQTRVSVPPTSPAFGSGTVPSNSAAPAAGSIDANTIAANLRRSIVNINTSLASGGAAAGTGIIISSSGLVLTNNHVIADTTALQVENSADGSVHRATLLGYDAADDIALIKIQNVSGLTAAPIGDASRVAKGDSIVALGNAGGQGGAPAVAVGQVTNLDQPITASDQNGANIEKLTHLIQVDASIQPGDSGGPLVNASGAVIGMNAAAAQSRSRFGFSGQGTTEAFAIPIQQALAVARQIEAGRAGATIHIGATRGILGVQVQDTSTTDGNAAATGAVVIGVGSGSGAEHAGIAAGDIITQINGTSVASASDLTHGLTSASPHTSVAVTWTDASGTAHHAKVVLGEGPPA